MPNEVKRRNAKCSCPLTALLVGCVLLNGIAAAGSVQGETDSATVQIFDPGVGAYVPDRIKAEIEETSKRDPCVDPHARCTWERTFGGPLQEKAYDIAAMPEDGVVLVGNRRAQGVFSHNAWILRLNRAGNLIWERTFGGRNSDQVYAVAPSGDGGVVIAGHTRSKGAGKSDIWVFRLDPDGDLVWERTLGGARDDRARGITAEANGGFVIAGFTQSRGSLEGDAWILRLDRGGELSWDRTFGNAGSDGIFQIASMPDGGSIATGYTDLGRPSGYDLWVIRLDEWGAPMWSRTMHRGIFDAGTCVVPTADGGSVIAGVTSVDGFRRDDAWVLRLDASGAVLWERVFGGPEPDAAWAVVPMPGSDYAVIAATSSYGAGSADAWVLGLDGGGTVIWERLHGGKLWDRPTAATRAVDGGLFVAGYTTTKGAGQEDYWLLLAFKVGRQRPVLNARESRRFGEASASLGLYRRS
jgi:hypothetical protein